MKKTVIVFFIAVVVFACNSNEKESESTKPGTEKTESAPDNSSNPDYQKGLALVGKSDCFTCHKIEDKIVGPTYREVAEKYAGASPDVISDLADKVIKGGSGVWGEALMNPHPQLSKEDAEAMVKYILLLKK